MKKHLILFFSLLLLCAQMLGSCVKNDPFKNDPNQSGEFYTLSDKEALEKYGDKYSMAAVCMHDDLYRYTWGNYEYRVGEMTKTVSTIYKAPIRDIDDISPACSDPLCKHTPDSGCVFANANRCIYGSGSLYFSTYDIFEEHNNYILYRYNEKTNTRTKIDESDAAFTLNSVNGVFSYSKIAEDDDLFENSVEYYTISEDGTKKRFAVIDIDHRGTPYDERKTVCSKKDQNSNIYYLYVYDFASGEETVIDQAKDFQFVLYGLYGKKLFTLNEETKIWFFYDLETGERSDLGTSEEIKVLAYTDRCIVINEKRTTSDDPFVIRILYPKTGETESYDLCEILGEAIDGDVKALFDLGVVSLYTSSSGKDGWICEIDLLSGRTRPIENGDSE